MSSTLPTRPPLRPLPGPGAPRSQWRLRSGAVTRGMLSYFTTHPDHDEDRWDPDLVPAPLRKNVRDSDAWSFIDRGNGGEMEEEEEEEDGEEKKGEDEEEEYSVLPKTQKRLIITLIALAGSISGLSSNIYNPAQNEIARDLGVSTSQVKLTITSYLVIQGIAPLLWGPLSDTIGRRPVYLASFSIYVFANVVLSFSPSFIILLIFRGVQSGGSASTASIGNGVLQDLVPIAQRGGYIPFYQGVRNFAVAFGPVLGGVMSQYLGFRSIFIFLLGLAGLATIGLVIFLPETMRSIAGNGSWKLHGIYQPLFRLFWKPPYVRDPRPDEKPHRKPVTVSTFTGPFKMLTQKEVAVNVWFIGLVYAIWSMVTSSLPLLFQINFKFNEIQIGLSYLPNGFGTIIGAAIIGKLMNRDFDAAAQDYKQIHNLPDDYELSSKKVPSDFPIERIRLRRVPVILAIFTSSLAAYGFSLSFPAASARPGYVALPLALHFIISASANCLFSINQALVSDLCPGKGASGAGINNLVRCGLAAVMVAFVEDMIMMLGPGATFLGLAFLVITFTPLVLSNWVWGIQWRQERAEKEKREQERK